MFLKRHLEFVINISHQLNCVVEQTKKPRRKITLVFKLRSLKVNQFNDLADLSLLNITSPLGTDWIRSWMDLKICLDVMAKKVSAAAGSRTSSNW